MLFYLPESKAWPVYEFINQRNYLCDCAGRSILYDIQKKCILERSKRYGV